MKLRTVTFVVYVACVGVAGAPRAAAGQQGGAAPPAPYRLVPEFVAPVTPPEITVQQTAEGPMLADVKGFTLYVTDRDKEPGKSSCYSACAEQWVPVRAPADAKPSGDFSIVPRDDGRSQWAYKGRPVYRYAHEAKPRWAEAPNEFWRAASLTVFPTIGAEGGRASRRAITAKIVMPPSPGGIMGQPSRVGVVFADYKGMTLYSPKVGVVCNDACLDSWLPLTAGLSAAPVGDWTIVARTDGIRQWAYEGRPVYRSVKDLKPTDISGADDEWNLVLVPAPGTAPAKASALKPAAK